MNELSCKSCGGTLEFEDGQSVAVCDSCGKKQTLPRFHSDKKKNLFARAGQLCRASKFDKALSCYEDALKEDAEDPEVHWMMAMCRYGVEYVEEADGKRKPTIHRIQDRSVLVDPDYKEALKYADDEQKAVYEAEAREIDRIQKAFLDIARNEKPFDVFICYKETGEDGKRTPDSALANDLYHSLTTEGFKVFYAAITLEDKLGVDYEPYIFAALQSARVMVVLGTKKEHFEATWVRNEWNRYLALIEDEKEKNGISKRTLIPAYRDMDAYDLPEEFAHLQAMDMSKLGFIQDLIRGIKKLLGGSNEKQAAPQQAAAPAAGKTNLSNLETRMFNFCQDGDWRKAEEYAERVLDNDPNNGKAYLGHLLVEAKCHNVNELQMSTKLLPEYRYFANAMEKGDAQQKKMLQELTLAVTKRMEQEKNDAAYANAMRALQKANETQEERAAVDAMHIFRELNGWRDSEKKAKESEELVDAIRAEKKRVADEQKAAEKKRRTRKLITRVVVVAAIAILIWYNVVGKKDMAYRKAMKLIAQENYLEAYGILADLGDYKNAGGAIVHSKCDRANALIDAGELDAAKNLIWEHIDAPEAQQVMERINYEFGKEALAKNDYDYAYSCLQASNSYADADELMAESKYTRAQAAVEAADYKEVYALLNGIEGYKDAADILQKTHYANAMENLVAEDYGAALLNYYRAGDYEDSLAKTEELLEGNLALGNYMPAYRVLLETDPERAEELRSEHEWLDIVGASIGQNVVFGYYEQDNDKDNGPEPIVWMVLGQEDGRKLLLAAQNIECKAFDADESGEGLTWENSDLREWLNSEFLEKAFDDETRRQIAETVNTNPDVDINVMVEGYNIPGGYEYFEDFQGYDNGEDTTDKVFLLSYPEMVRYGISEAATGGHTEYSQSRSYEGMWSCADDNWLRTIATQGAPVYQLSDGRIWYGPGMGIGGDSTPNLAKGVRPAVWVEVEE